MLEISEWNSRYIKRYIESVLENDSIEAGSITVSKNIMLKVDNYLQKAEQNKQELLEEIKSIVDQFENYKKQCEQTLQGLTQKQKELQEALNTARDSIITLSDENNSLKEENKYLNNAYNKLIEQTTKNTVWVNSEGELNLEPIKEDNESFDFNKYKEATNNFFNAIKSKYNLD